MHMASKTEVAREALAPVEPRGAGFYVRGTLLFLKRMWPAVYDLSTSEVYVFASAIAFNAILSFFSFVVLIGSLLVNVLHWQEGYATIYHLLIAFVPVESGLLFQSLDQVTRGPGGQASVISFALLVLTSSGVFLPVEIALNRAWGFEKPRGLIKQRIVYLVLVIICGLIMLACVALASIWDQGLARLLGDLPIRQQLFNLIGTLVSMPFIALVFFLIYYAVPHGRVRARQVFFAAAAMAVLWVAVTIGYRLALPLLNFKGAYGRLYAVMAVIIWAFISSFILILGANLSARQVLPVAWTGRRRD
jgi:membrane protein